MALVAKVFVYRYHEAVSKCTPSDILRLNILRFSDLKLLDMIPTSLNPRGLLSLCVDPNHIVLAFPGLTTGHAKVELYDLKRASVFRAHESELAQMALNSDGKILATASDKGTLIRLWDTVSADPIRQGCSSVHIPLSYSTCCSTCSSPCQRVPTRSRQGRNILSVLRSLWLSSCLLQVSMLPIAPSCA